MQERTGFTADQIGEMNDEQLLFWYSGGKSAKPKRHAVEMSMDPKKSFAENMAEFQRRIAEWEAENGKNR